MRADLEKLSLTLLNSGFVDLDKKWDYDNVISPFFRIYYISDGEGYVYHNNQTFLLEPGYLYLIPSFTYSRYKCDHYLQQYYLSALEENESGISIFSSKSFNFKVKADKLSITYFKRLIELNPNRIILRDDPKIYDNREGLISYKKENDRLTDSAFIETKGILMGLLSKFINTNNYVSLKGQKITSISKISNYIKQHLHDDISVGQLAEICNLNVDYFSREFKKIYEERPNQYIQNRRIERAQLLLVTTANSLQEISEKIGFNNVSYFSKMFKKIVGISPLQFRKEQWKM